MTDASEGADDWDFTGADDDDEKERERFLALLPKAIEVAQAANFETRTAQNDWGDSYLTIVIPSGRHKRQVILDDSNELAIFSSLEFEGLSFVDGLEAICDHKNGTVEAGIEMVSRGAISSVSRLFFRNSSGQVDTSARLDLEDGQGKFHCKVGYASELFKVLSLRHRHRGLTITMDLDDLKVGDDIKDRLIKITNSLFFQIDLLSNHPLSLSRARPAISSGRAFKRQALKLNDIKYPEHEYDEAPCSLYWYGRAASAMPLLQFLAFYQVVEFFYPVHSRAEVHRRLRMVLNDPSFRPDRDTDLARVISTLALNRAGGFMDERSQLKAVLNECTTSQSIQDFLNSTDEKAEYYRGGYKKLSKIKIPLDERSQDIRGAVAERLYAIRCRIVHTKDDGSEELGILLPYSDEEAAMAHDIELMQFVARAVLIASGMKTR